MNDFLTLLLVFVELNVQNLPVTYTDTGMAALMAMVAIVTTKVLHLTLMVDSDFINITPYLSHHIWSRVRDGTAVHFPTDGCQQIVGSLGLHSCGAK